MKPGWLCLKRPIVKRENLLLCSLDVLYSIVIISEKVVVKKVWIGKKVVSANHRRLGCKKTSVKTVRRSHKKRGGRSAKR